MSAEQEWFEDQPWVPQYGVNGACSVCGALVGAQKIKHGAFHAYVWRLVAGQQALNDEELAKLREFFARLDQEEADRG